MSKRKSYRIRKSAPEVAKPGNRQKLINLLDEADEQDRIERGVNYARACEEDDKYKAEISERADLEARLEAEDAARIAVAGMTGMALDPETLEIKPASELSPDVQKALELKYLGEPNPPSECGSFTGLYDHGWASDAKTRQPILHPVPESMGLLVRNDSGKLVPANQNSCGFHVPDPDAPRYSPDKTSPIILNYLLKNGITEQQIADYFQGKKFNLHDARKMLRETQEAIQNGKTVVLLDNGLPKHNVTLMRDHTEDYPELYLQVHVIGPSWEALPFLEMLTRSRCARSKTIEDADLVIFTGGADVSPVLYGEEAHHSTAPSKMRDEVDVAAFIKCIELGIPMFGVCRGAQLGHVGHGGVLYQDVDNHNRAHSIWDVNRKITIDKASSVHHQMCKEVDNGMELIAVATESRKRVINPKETEEGKNADIEAFFYKDTCFIGVQGHPEYSGYPQYTKWCLDLINELVLCNPDIEWNDSCRRIRPDILAGRDYEIPQSFRDFIEPPVEPKAKPSRKKKDK